MDVDNPENFSTPVSTPTSRTRKRIFSELEGSFFAPVAERHIVMREQRIIQLTEESLLNLNPQPLEPALGLPPGFALEPAFAPEPALQPILVPESVAESETETESEPETEIETESDTETEIESVSVSASELAFDLDSELTLNDQDNMIFRIR